MRPERATSDWSIALAAARQHDVLTIEQLFAAGLSRSAVKRRVRDGRLHRIFRGVYTPGTPNLTRESYWMAAVLSVGKDAVLSHGSAAATKDSPPRAPVKSTSPVPGSGGRRKRHGIVVHRSTTLTPEDTTIHRGIPVTTVARTLRDLGYRERTRSDLERLFLSLCRKRGIRKPEANVEIGPSEVDFLWRAERLIAPAIASSNGAGS